MGGVILTSYIGAVCGNRISRSFGMNGGYFRASKLRQARQASELELPSIQSSNHLNHWVDSGLIYKSLNLLGPRPPPTDRLSSDLSLYGGKYSNVEVTRLHAPEKKPATLFTRSSAAALFEAENTSFQSPKRQTDNHFGLLFDRFTIWRWNRLHRSLHAPPCAGKAPATCFTRAHAPNTCPRVPGTRLHATGTRQRQVSLHGFARSALNLQSSCHVAGKKKKKKKKLVRRNGAFYGPNSSSRPLWPRLKTKFS
uniref:Uncharacterized protein n=1 Tax=Fagus sylvatica TaxID=28930 RepID=A0A2N9I918_FAGSY